MTCVGRIFKRVTETTDASPYWQRALIALDVCLGVLLGGPLNVTISSRLGLNRDRWWGRIGSRVLGSIQPGHVDDAIRWDAERAEEAIRTLRVGIRLAAPVPRPPGRPS